MSNVYKLAMVQIGDTIIYKSDTGRRAVGKVRGWVTRGNTRYVLIEGGALSLNRVLERHRFGASAIIFDETERAEQHA